jgi:hypothetical protein
MLYLLEINGLAGEVLQVVHDDLLPVWNENGNSIVL